MNLFGSNQNMDIDLTTGFLSSSQSAIQVVTGAIGSIGILLFNIRNFQKLLGSRKADGI
jgi:hypothetical protein